MISRTFIIDWNKADDLHTYIDYVLQMVDEGFIASHRKTEYNEEGEYQLTAYFEKADNNPELIEAHKRNARIFKEALKHFKPK
jgi:hypothetical protein